jgi:hypothetical protein
MIDYIYLGSSPANEPCAQTTDPDYGVKALDECRRYRALLESTYSAAHDGQPCPVRLVVKGEPHDFGTYYEVVAKFSDGDRAALEAALWLEENSPVNWPEPTEKSLCVWEPAGCVMIVASVQGRCMNGANKFH